MDIIFFGNGARSLPCLKVIKNSSHTIKAIITHPKIESKWFAQLSQIAEISNIPLFSPKNPNEKVFENTLKFFHADLFILAGYGKILKNNIIQIPKIMCLNLHGGKLPKYRGSSPMNWALINGEDFFTLSIIQLVKLIDGGPVLMEKTFDINENTTIVDLHKIANHEFPKMLVHVLENIESDTLKISKQDEKNASYYPIRVPEDGFILWDVFNAKEIHNRIRALTAPYPCAFSFFQNKKIKFISSELNKKSFFGEPGRIYKIKDDRFLVSTKEGSLWITEAFFDESRLPFLPVGNRYESFSTIKEIGLNIYKNKNLDENKK
ncbi:MAG: hypothetical protein CMG55_08745 [Candidatus Marinimicrobia bacterium]|nr:hypothetical protein [Candidatus Neomarinimicrobiota bacterium]|tara:strand:+ start:534 stop:1496 length:963 start_codon:yes stop_codon:yes gene_type:complete